FRSGGGATLWRTLPWGRRNGALTLFRAKQRPSLSHFASTPCFPLDDCLYALQATIPHLACSALHRCFQRHGISRLQHLDAASSARKKFKTYSCGYFHINLTQART